MARLSRSERDRHGADVMRGSAALVFTTALAVLVAAEHDPAAGGPAATWTEGTLSGLAVGIVMVCMAIRAAYPRLSRTAVVAMTVALGLVVGGEVATLAVATTRGDALLAGTLLASGGFTLWFLYGVATDDGRRAAERQRTERDAR